MVPAIRRKTNYDRLKINDKLDEGEAVAVVAREHGVTASAISRIRKTKSQLRVLALSENAKSLCNKKSLKTTSFPDVEKALLMWLHQKRQSGYHISGPNLCAKALLFNEKLNGPKNFKASQGWLEKFKRRHGMTQLTFKGEDLSSNPEAAETFKDNFRKYITENGYGLENLYNADETGWNWRSLPRKALALDDENEVEKIDEERVTVMFCANAWGTHRIPTLVIGKSENENDEKPTNFKDIITAPVTYKTHPKALMNRVLFMEWYTKCFIPAVKKKQWEIGRVEKVLLLLDNAPSHPSVTELNSVDESFQVLCLPPNVASLVQPMCQGVIETTKRIYKRSIAQRLALSDDESLVVQFMRDLSLKDCCEMIANAWEEMSVSGLQDAWTNLIADGTLIEEVAPAITDAELRATVNAIPGISVSEFEIKTWMQEDSALETSEKLDDDQIVAFITRTEVDENQDVNTVEEAHKLETEQDPLAPLPPCLLDSFPEVDENHDVNTAEEIRKMETEQDPLAPSPPCLLVSLQEVGENHHARTVEEINKLKTEQEPIVPLPTAQDAVSGINAAYAWFEMQPECTINDLIVLNRLRELATLKAMS